MVAMDRNQQEAQVRCVLEMMESLAALLVDRVQGDARLQRWAGKVEMVAREFKAVPLCGQQARWQSVENNEEA
jgi:hypothetical protein